MVVRIRLFAMLRERAGRSELELELPEGASVSDALEADQLRALAGGLPLVMAINREYARADAPLHAGDELALIPPVSGGAVDARQSHAAITDQPLSLDRLLAFVRDPRAGAIVTFEGVTREVEELHYEAYVEMAQPRLAAIVEQAIERHGLCAAAAEHRVGTVALSEPSVAVAVSAAHRAEAFAGARELIDRIKAEAPIWKREGAEWVTGSPPGR
ncbi:MAG TPA: molybdenum cofactor biosynthesis protein MoaE [Solirubrobacteraceae bacterium]|nr:molybdenum cofactor biosynthesis protein MoaE [Solirubrobacteraceae bacterium]